MVELMRVRGERVVVLLLEVQALYRHGMGAGMGERSS